MIIIYVINKNNHHFIPKFYNSIVSDTKKENYFTGEMLLLAP